MRPQKFWISNRHTAQGPVIWNIGETEEEAAKALTLGPISRNENRRLETRDGNDSGACPAEPALEAEAKAAAAETETSETPEEGE